MRKIIALLIGALIMISGIAPASAFEENSILEKLIRVQEESGEILQSLQVKVALSPSYGGEQAMLSVIHLPKENGQPDFSDAGNYAAIHQSVVDSRGQLLFEHAFNVDAGYYQIRVITEGLAAPITKNLYISSVDQIKELLNKLKNQEISSLMLQEIFNAHPREYGIEDYMYQKISTQAKAQVAEAIVASSQSGQLNKFNEIFITNVILKGIEVNSSSSVVKDILSYYGEEWLNLSQHNQYSVFASLKDQNMVYQLMANKPCNTLLDVEKHFGDMTVLSSFKQIVSHSQISDKIKEFASYLDLSNYATRLTGNTSLIENYIAGKLSSLTDIEGLKEVIRYAIDNRNSFDKPTHSGNKGNGSGGGGAISVSSELIDVKVPDILPKSNFSDISENYWGEKAISYLSEKGVISGNPSGNFLPEKPVTRAEFLKMVVAAFGLLNHGGENPFTDVPSKSWYSPYVSAAYSVGLILGNEEGAFRPEDQISRQDAAVLLLRVLELKNMLSDESGAGQFSDQHTIAEYAKKAVETLTASKLIQGFSDGTFRPNGILTRAEAAQLLYNAVTK